MLRSRGPPRPTNFLKFSNPPESRTEGSAGKFRLPSSSLQSKYLLLGHAALTVATWARSTYRRWFKANPIRPELFTGSAQHGFRSVPACCGVVSDGFAIFGPLVHLFRQFYYLIRAVILARRKKLRKIVRIIFLKILKCSCSKLSRAFGCDTIRCWAGVWLVSCPFR